MDRSRREMLEDLRRRLESRSFLADDVRAYRAGVDDALDEVATVLDAGDIGHETDATSRRLSAPAR